MLEPSARSATPLAIEPGACLCAKNADSHVYQVRRTQLNSAVAEGVDCATYHRTMEPGITRKDHRWRRRVQIGRAHV